MATDAPATAGVAVADAPAAVRLEAAPELLGVGVASFPAQPAEPASSPSSCGECGSAAVAARAAARARTDASAPGTAPSADSAPAGSGPWSPCPADGSSGGSRRVWPDAVVPPVSPESVWPLSRRRSSPSPVPVAPEVPAPSADPARVGTRAVAADPIGTGSAADATFSGPDDAARMTATDPPAARKRERRRDEHAL